MPFGALQEVAGPTRLELATSGVTGRRSNQLNYDPAQVCLRAQRTEPRFYRIPAIAADDRPLVWMVGGTGFEPVTAGV